MNEKEKNVYADVGLNEKPSIENVTMTKEWTCNWRVDTLNRARWARLYNKAVENLVNAYGIRHEKKEKGKSTGTMME